MVSHKKTRPSRNKRSRDEDNDDAQPPRSRRRLTTPPSSERCRNPSCAPDEERVNRLEGDVSRLPLPSPAREERCSNPPCAPDERVTDQVALDNTTVTTSCPSQAADQTSAQPAATTVPTNTNPPSDPIPPVDSVSGIPHIDYTNARPSVFHFVDCTHARHDCDITLTRGEQAVLALRLLPVCLTCRKAMKKEFTEGADNCRCIANILGPFHCGRCRFTAYRETVDRARLQIEWLNSQNHRHVDGAEDGEIVAPEEFMNFDYEAVTFAEIRSELRARGVSIRATDNTKESLVAMLTESDKECWRLCPCGQAASESDDETVMYCTACDGYIVRRRRIFDLKNPWKNNASTGKFGLTYQECWELTEKRKKEEKERREKEEREAEEREEEEEEEREKMEKEAAQLRMRRVLRSLGYTDEAQPEAPQNEGANTSANPKAPAPHNESPATTPSGSAPGKKKEKSTEKNEESQKETKGKGKKAETMPPPTRVSTRAKKPSLKAKENAGN